MNLNSYLTYNQDKSVVVKTESMQVRIPVSYTKYRMLKIQDTVTTLAIFDIYVGTNPPMQLLLPAVIEMRPSTITQQTIDGIDYAVLTFSRGDVFMCTTRLVQTEYIAYVLFTEFIENARIPSGMTYDQIAFIFDTVVRVTGSKVPAEHAIYEIIFAHLARDSKDISIPYRLTAMTAPPTHLKLTDIPHVATSVSTKLLGSYLNNSMTTAVINEADHNSDVEDLLRQ